jgi:hypothetical protein
MSAAVEFIINDSFEGLNPNVMEISFSVSPERVIVL